jgi:HAE1 family hydrophobic/amphiphilic exporter-1
MQWLAEVCVKRPVFATVLILVICVIGIFGYGKLGVDRFPTIDLPIVTVTTRLPGAAPEDVETEITDKVEEAVNTISGIDELRSVSAEGTSQVFITFLLEKDGDVAAQEVRDRLNTVIPDLPRGIDLPLVTKLDPDASPVLFIALEAPGKDVREVTEVADKRVRRLIESISGVGRVAVVGGRKRQINIQLDPLKLRGLQLTAADVQRTIAAQNLTVPGGRMESGPSELTLRVHGRVGRAAEIGDLVIKTVAGAPLRIRDVAVVEDGAEEQSSVAERNGAPTVLLTVRKQSGSNTVAVVAEVRARLGDVQKALPAGYSLQVVRDDSGVIKTSVDAVKEHLIAGAILAALVVLLFLGNWRSTIIAAIAIPTSIIGTFALMWQQGFTLNTITLLALALAVGIVIDDAIVVLENIFRFVDEKGVKPFDAAIEATKEIGLAVLATTLSLIAVFLPVAFMAGIPGRFLKSFGVTMAFAITVSLLVSFSLTPMLAARWLKERPLDHKTRQKPFLERLVDVFYRPIERFYLRVLQFSMAHRWVIVVACVLTLGSCFPLAGLARKGFLPVNDEGQFEVNVRAPEGASIAATRLIGDRIARQIRALPEVDQVVLRAGDDEQRTPNLANIYVHLTDPRDRKLTQDDVKAVVRETIVAPLRKDLRISIGDISAFSGGGFSTAKIQYAISGPDLGVLERISDDVLKKLRKVPGAVDVDSSLISGKPELGVYVDRGRAADLGVQVADIANALRLLVGGDKVGTYEEKGEEYEIRARAAQGYRADEAGLRLITVPSTKAGQVELADVVQLRKSVGPAAISRLNRRRQVVIYANPAPGYGESQIAEPLAKIIAGEKLSGEYVASAAGNTRETARTAQNFGLAFLLSFIFMYLVLAAQFESWLHPITILISLPLTLPFAILSVILFHQALDIFSALGILVLFGVVKKNAILQIDHTNGLRRHGMPRLEAILTANRDRLRPILMTTLAFVAGMIPLVLSRGVGSGFNRATAGVVVGGQVLSLLLTLLAAPVFYSLFDDLSNALRRLFRMAPSNEFAPDAAPAVPVVRETA